jgi:transcriptional regulator with XRE-family HTH domain
VTSGQLLREARLRAGLSQYDLAERTGIPRSQITRWESGVNEPSLSALRRAIRACGWEISLELKPYTRDVERERRLEELHELTPQQRLELMIEERTEP